jgi:hypothetical protein
MVSQNWMRLRSRPMSCEQALVAIYAARHRNQWGRWATVRYCEKRGVPRRLLTLAIQLSVITD